MLAGCQKHSTSSLTISESSLIGVLENVLSLDGPAVVLKQDWHEWANRIEIESPYGGTESLFSSCDGIGFLELGAVGSDILWLDQARAVSDDLVILVEDDVGDTIRNRDVVLRVRVVSGNSCLRACK